MGRKSKCMIAGFVAGMFFLGTFPVPVYAVPGLRAVRTALMAKKAKDALTEDEDPKTEEKNPKSPESKESTDTNTNTSGGRPRLRDRIRSLANE